MAHRSFDAAAREATGEPITFTVDPYPSIFRVQTPLPMGQLILFSRAVSGEVKDQVGALDQLLRTWLVEEDRAEWDRCLGQLANIEVLADILNYVVEESTGRPITAPSTSPT